MTSTNEHSTASPPRTGLGRVVAASLIGTAVEWYDFFLYGSAAALVFNKLFFPTSDPLVGVMLAFLTYALGFVARPIGGLVFGHFGDRVGRKKLLMLSLLLMGTSTAAIGLLPTYGSIGMWAAILLTTLRLVQGFAVGGEWGGAVLLISEHGSAERRGFWASWPQAGVPVGNLLATAVLAILAATMDDATFLAWAGASRSCSPRAWSSSVSGSATPSKTRPPSSKPRRSPRPVRLRAGRRPWKPCAATPSRSSSAWPPASGRTSPTTSSPRSSSPTSPPT